GKAVRLKSAYIIRCEDYSKDENGQVTEVRAVYLPESKSGQDATGLKVKATIHWLSVAHARSAEVRLYDRLFRVEDPANAEGDFTDYLNPDSLKVVPHAMIEPA